ncbi:hypothetical protein LguiA_011574 [Lonicera macranthoides]
MLFKVLYLSVACIKYTGKNFKEVEELFQAVGTWEFGRGRDNNRTKKKLKLHIIQVTMPLIRTSAIPNTCQQIKVRVRAATDEVVAKIMVDQPATEEGSEGSIQIFLDEEIRIIKNARIAELEARQKAELEAMEARQKASDEAMEARVRDLVSSMMANLPMGGGRSREV